MSEAALLPPTSSFPANADQQSATETNVNPSDVVQNERTTLLEEKVSELEKKLAELNKNLLDERSMYESQLLTKTTDLDALRIKVNRLEFATKEAIIFLSKPLEKAKEPLEAALRNALGSNGSINSIASSKASTFGKKSNDVSRNPESGDKSKSPQKNPVSTIPPVSGVPRLTPLEAECLECIRYSIRYLQKAQAATNHVSPAGHLRPGAGVAGFGTTEKIEREAGESRLEKSSNNIDSLDNADSMPYSSLQRRTSAKYNKSNTTSKGMSPEKVTGILESKGPTPEINHSVWAQGNSANYQELTRSILESDKLSVKYHSRAHSGPPSLGSGFGSTFPDDGDSDITSGDISENLTFSPVGGELTGSGKFNSSSSLTQSRTATVQQPLFNRGLLGTKCLHCRELLLQIDRHNDIENDLKSDIAALAAKLAEEQVGHAQTAMGKSLLEQEMEDLTASLFDQANHMVMEESAMRDALEKKNRELEGKLEKTLAAFTTREEELSSLRKTLKGLELARKRSLSRTGSTTGDSVLNLSPHSTRDSQHLGRSATSSETSLDSSDGFSSGSRLPRFTYRDHVEPNVVHVDVVTYSEFQDHLKAAAKATASTYATLQTNFLKRVMNDDIEPCLFHGSTGWKLPFLKNRLLNAIIKDTIEIRHWLAKHATETENLVSRGSSSSKKGSDNSSVSSSATPAGENVVSNSKSKQKPSAPGSNPPHVKCSACGSLRHCEYQIRLDAPDNPSERGSLSTANPATFFGLPSASAAGNPEIDASSWQPLDRFCRDRVVAVCDFYLFLSQLRQGLLGKCAPLLGMFRQCVWYRRRMALARIGNTELFEGLDGQSIKRLSVADLDGKKITVVP